MNVNVTESDCGAHFLSSPEKCHSARNGSKTRELRRELAPEEHNFVDRNCRE